MTIGADMAFPANGLHKDSTYENADWTGLSKREYFAAAALQGMLASGDGEEEHPTRIAEYAVECADALLKALSAAEQ